MNYLQLIHHTVVNYMLMMLSITYGSSSGLILNPVGWGCPCFFAERGCVAVLSCSDTWDKGCLKTSWWDTRMLAGCLIPIYGMVPHLSIPWNVLPGTKSLSGGIAFVCCYYILYVCIGVHTCICVYAYINELDYISNVKSLVKDLTISISRFGLLN